MCQMEPSFSDEDSEADTDPEGNGSFDGQKLDCEPKQVELLTQVSQAQTQMPQALM